MDIDKMSYFYLILIIHWLIFPFKILLGSQKKKIMFHLDELSCTETKTAIKNKTRSLRTLTDCILFQFFIGTIHS